jgi:hypothetical protein
MRNLVSAWWKRFGLAAGLLGLWVLGLSVASAMQVQTAQKHPRPTGQELAKAEKVVLEVFGRDIAKARTPSEKGKLAQEILRAAREEQDMAVRFAALQVARRLAISAQDGKLGLEIVGEIVDRFQPLEEMSPADRLAEADRLWQQAERLSGQEKLAKQLEAAEKYLYLAPTATGWTKVKIEKRLTGLAGAPLQIAKSSLSLCRINPLSVKAWNNLYAVNKSPVNVWPMLPERWEWCQEYVFSHAPSRLTYSIPEGMRFFTAVGYCVVSGGHVAFLVEVDGVLQFKQTGSAVPVQVNIPSGAKQIGLVIDDLGDRTSDHSFWLYPRFHPKKPDSLTGPLPQHSQSLIELKPVFASTSYRVSVEGIPDVVPPINIDFPIKCEEFLFAHAPSELVYPVPPRVVRFTATGYCLNKNSVRFKVLGDGKVLYESPRAGIVYIAVAIPQGTRLISLVVDDLGNNAFDKSFWCYPRFWQE